MELRQVSVGRRNGGKALFRSRAMETCPGGKDSETCSGSQQPSVDKQESTESNVDLDFENVLTKTLQQLKARCYSNVNADWSGQALFHLLCTLPPTKMLKALTINYINDRHH